MPLCRGITREALEWRKKKRENLGRKVSNSWWGIRIPIRKRTLLPQGNDGNVQNV